MLYIEQKTNKDLKKMKLLVNKIKYDLFLIHKLNIYI